MSGHAELQGPPFRARGVVDRLALLLAKLGEEVLAHAEPKLSAHAGLTGRQYMALAVLERDEPGSQQELAALLNKAPALVVALIDELETLGYVARSRDPADRRRTRVELTAEGRAALIRGDEVAARVESELFGGRSAEVLAAVSSGLEAGAALQ